MLCFDPTRFSVSPFGKGNPPAPQGVLSEIVMKHAISVREKPGAALKATSLTCTLTFFLVAWFNSGAQGSLTTANAAESQSSAVLQKFEAWANQYVGIPDLRSKARLHGQGLALAKARRTALLQLIRTDPKRAIGAALPLRLRRELPSEITCEFETCISGTGDLSVIGVLAKPGDMIVEPIQRFVTINGKMYRAYTHGRLMAQTTKKNLPIRGVGMDGILAFEEESGIKIEWRLDKTQNFLTQWFALSGLGAVSEEYTS